MRSAVGQLIRAHGVALLPGSQNSRGARLERDIAERLEMPVADLADWLNAQPDPTTD